MNNFQKLTEMARPIYENFNDPSHDFAHINRVMSTCKKIGESEGADLEVLMPAALLHDIVNIPKNHPNRSKASEFAADKSREMMIICGFDKKVIDKTHTAIVEHSFSRGLKPSTLEAAVVQDADRLDALGAIGVMRMITVGTKFGANYYHVADPFAESREYDDKNFSLDHFYTKLFKLPELMNTKSAAREATRRVSFMKSFIDELKSEI